MLFISIGLRFGLNFVSGWLLVMHTYLYYLPLSLSLFTHVVNDGVRSIQAGIICRRLSVSHTLHMYAAAELLARIGCKSVGDVSATRRRTEAAAA